jgi:hypothetical protein
MRKGLGLTIAWVGATIVAVVVAAAAVGSVRSQVTDTPTALGAPTAVAMAAAPPADTPPLDTGSVTTTVPSSTIAPVPGSAGESTTSTAATSSVDGTTTTTTSTNSTITTTTTPTVWQQLPPYSTPGGTVTILVNGDSVKFGGAVPTTGWTVEFEKLGPPEVEIHFERNDDEGDEAEFHAKYEDGELVVKIS